MYERFTVQPPRPPGKPLEAATGTDLPRLTDIPAIVSRNWRGVAGSVVVGFLLAALFILLAVPSFIAVTQIIIDPTDLRVVDNSLRPQGGLSETQIAQVEDEVRVISSSAVLRRVVEKERLVDDGEFSGSAPSSLGNLLKTIGVAGRSSDAESRVNAAMRALAKKVAVKREERTFVVSVAVTTSDPDKSAKLADAIVTAFLEVAAERRNQASVRVTDSLTGRLSNLRHDVEAAEQRLLDFKVEHKILAAVGQSVSEQQLVNASKTLGDVKTQATEAQSRYAQAVKAKQNGDIGAVPEAMQSTTVGSLKTQLAEVTRRESELSATLGDRHPLLREAQAQERAVKTLLRQELNRIAAVTRGNRDRALSDQASVEATFNGLEATVTSKNKFSVRLNELERDAQANRALYEAFRARAREVGEQATINTANISVISPAQAPETKSWPPRPAILLAAGAILGLIIGIAIAVARDLARGRRTPVRLDIAKAAR